MIQKIIFLFTILLALTATSVFAHVPVTTGANTHLESAYEIENPIKSWALYSELDKPNEVLYYSFSIQEGQTIYVSLLKAIRPENAGFNPHLLLFGETFSNTTSVSSFIERPAGYGVMELQNSSPKPTYEAFGPSSYDFIGEINIPAPKTGVYYVAIFDLSKGGYFNIAVGTQESFTLQEMILTPFNVINVYQWEGQSIFLIFLPHILTLIVGSFLIYRLNKDKEENIKSIKFWLVNIAGLAFLASGISVLTQMLISILNTSVSGDIIITLILALIPLSLGSITLYLNRNTRSRTIKTIGINTIIAVVGVLFWAGYIAGSIVMVLAQFLPKEQQKVIN